jgi:hypothetical protein
LLATSLIDSIVSAGALFVCVSYRALHFLSVILTFVADIRLLPDATSRNKTDLVFTVDLHKSALSVGQVYGSCHFGLCTIRCTPFAIIPSVIAELPSRSNDP